MYKGNEEYKKTNQLTEGIFTALEDASDGGLIKIKTIFQMSALAISSGLNEMTIDFTARFKPKNETFNFTLLSYAIWQKTSRPLIF